MRLRAEIRYDADPAAVFAMLTDAAFQERKCAATGALESEVEIERFADGGATIRTRRTMPTDQIPDFARGFVGRTVDVVQVDDFGPVVTAYVYDEKDWDGTLELIDESSPYGLTGAVFAEDRAAIQEAKDRLRYAAGNFYVNDKPTGAVVGQQPFGGARASGTNDKAGSPQNLQRWISTRSIKETFAPPTSHLYPHMR